MRSCSRLIALLTAVVVGVANAQNFNCATKSIAQGSTFESVLRSIPEEEAANIKEIRCSQHGITGSLPSMLKNFSSLDTL